MLRLAFTRPKDRNGDGILDSEGGDGRQVTLRTDPTQDTFDRYGRLLAYVTTRAGLNLQAQQLRPGWAMVYVFDKPFQRVACYRAVARGAKRAGRGVYGACRATFTASNEWTLGLLALGSGRG